MSGLVAFWVLIFANFLFEKNRAERECNSVEIVNLKEVATVFVQSYE